ncbi:MAG: 30S ribosomal protein S16 [Elusimicrobiota bacterium]
MAVAIRLKRIGKLLKPIYRVVAIDSKKRTVGKPIEQLGYYNPRDKNGKDISLNVERINYWIKAGAIVSDTVKGLLKKSQIQETQIDANK